MLADLSIKAFLTETASKSPVPGGGSVAALSAALAASLAEMVANLSVGRKGFENSQAEMEALQERAQALRVQLAEYIQWDADAYHQVMAAHGLPGGSPEEKQRRSKAIQAGLKQAARVPLEVAVHSLEILELAQTAVTQGNPNAVTDAAVGTMLARTAGLAALYNVKINLSSIRDKEFVENTAEEIQRLETEIVAREKRILAAIKL